MRDFLTLVEQQVAARPKAVAVSTAQASPASQVTYAQLWARADRLATLLAKQGVGRDAIVALSVARTIHLPVAVLGVLKAGAAYAPIDPAYPAARRQLMLDDCAATVVITDRLTRSALGDVSQHVILIDELFETDAPVAAVPLRQGDFERLAYVIFTSGSTGRPKGVAMPHRPLANLIEWQLTEARVGPGDRTLQFAPASFDVHFQEMFATWASGGELVMIQDDVRRDAAALAKFIDQHRIARLFLPFVALQMLADASVRLGLAQRQLRDVVTAGEQLQCTPQLRAWFAAMPAARLFNHYGPSETHVVTSYALDPDPRKWEALPPIGSVLPNVTVHILDEQRLPVAPGEVGELYFGGLAAARGYLGRADLTSERFVPEPMPTDAAAQRVAGWPGIMYKTGDTGRRDANGVLEYLGRNDTQVKIRGFRVELGEIEVALGNHPNVTGVAVGVRDAMPGSPRLVAWFTGLALPVGADGSHPLRAFLQDKLAEYMLPTAFVHVAALPRTPSGKIDRLALPNPFVGDHASAPPSVPPVGRAPTGGSRGAALADEVARLFFQTTGITIEAGRLGQDFAALGVDSMMRTQLGFALRERFAVRRADLVTEHSSLATIAAALDEALPPGPIPDAPPMLVQRPIDLANGGGSMPSQAFAMLYGKALGATADTCAVLVPPLAHELIRGHRAMRELARALAAQGLPTLIVEPTGNGDAQGDFAHATLARWVLDVRQAIGAAQAQTGARHVLLIGVRLGALVAAQCRGLASALLLVDPIVDGRHYLRTITELHDAMVADDWKFAASSNPAQRVAAHELIGEIWSPALREALAAAQLAAADGDWAQTAVVLPRDATPQAIEFASSAALHATHTVEAYGQWVEARQIEQTLMAESLLTAAVDAAKALLANITLAPPAPMPASASVAPLPPAPYREETWVFGDGAALVGVLTEPATLAADAPVLMILSAGYVHRAGPFRAAVGLARSFAARGWLVLRFDGNGIGDSEARSEGTADERALADIRDAVAAVLAVYGQRKIVAFGICSGAIGAHLALGVPEVTAAIMVDGYAYETQRFRLQRLASKLGDINRVRAFVSRKLHQAITQATGREATVDSNANRGGAGEQYGWRVDLEQAAQNPMVLDSFPPAAQVNRDLAAAAARDARAMFVFTGGAQSYYNYQSQLADGVPAVHNPRSFRVCLWPHTDHTFVLQADREQLATEMLQFLKDLTPGRGAPP